MRPGDVVADQFVLEELAGSGGMGEVYRARDRRTNRPVALKTLRGREDVEAIARFVRESKALARLSHPAIVGYVAHGRTGSGEMFLAMEWLEGEPLAERLHRTGVSVEEAVAIARRVAEALAVAHRQGIVHRDVKPGNIFLVGAKGEPDPASLKLVDFGLARLRGSFGDVTVSGAMLGTAGYMAPEQARGDRTIDARADVYSLGCVLFRCVAGRRVFSGDLMAVLVKVVIEEAPRLADICDDVPPELDALVARMLSKQREDRPADGEAVARELAALGPLRGPTRRREPEPSLTTNERRFMCLLLAGAPPAAERRDPARDDALRAAIARHGGRLDSLANGARLVTLERAASETHPRAVDGGGAAADEAARAARCALALEARSATRRSPSWPGAPSSSARCRSARRSTAASSSSPAPSRAARRS